MGEKLGKIWGCDFGVPIQDPDHGSVMQLQGDIRKEAGISG